ncbi:Pkinase-domain-containing protein [Auriculariales sp. MPI-PUGE-AT-0066]|nr:Pkinase-domain-containing protein [Auriculariales sp. MPI-PUGE-AT-0066]
MTDSSHVAAETASSDPKLADLVVETLLGTGTFAKVLLVRNNNASKRPDLPEFFALKVLRKTEMVRQRQVDHIKAERLLLSRISHPFIVRLYGAFQDQLNVYLLLPFIPGGELFSHLRNAKRFEPPVARFYLANVVLALRYLHDLGIAYRDLKPENLLLDAQGYVSMTDFGFAKRVEDTTYTTCGTPDYLAPEIIEARGHGPAVDWWACGVLIYEMLVGFPPFCAETTLAVYKRALRCDVRWPRANGIHIIDPLSQQVTMGFLTVDLARRLGNMNGGAADVMRHPWFAGVDWAALERREYTAPIVPHLLGPNDARYFTSERRTPSLRDMPGLTATASPLPEPEPDDPIQAQFQDF